MSENSKILTTFRDNYLYFLLKFSKIQYGIAKMAPAEKFLGWSIVLRTSRRVVITGVSNV